MKVYKVLSIALASMTVGIITSPSQALADTRYDAAWSFQVQNTILGQAYNGSLFGTDNADRHVKFVHDNRGIETVIDIEPKNDSSGSCEMFVSTKVRPDEADYQYDTVTKIVNCSFIPNAVIIGDRYDPQIKLVLTYDDSTSPEEQAIVDKLDETTRYANPHGEEY